MHASRRAFLRTAAGLAAGGGITSPAGLSLATSLAGLGTLAAQNASAATVNDGYKALVCLYMAGGNDSHNWIVPGDAASYASYAAARGSLAWPGARLLPISSSTQGGGRSFAMPSELAALRNWYEAGMAAVIANVGPLVQPTTKADFRAGVGLPPKLFSHNDQAAVWQSLHPEGANSGWGGRMGDLLMASNQMPAFTALSTTGNAVFLNGDNVIPYRLGTAGPTVINAVQPGWRAGSSTMPAALRQLLAGSGANAYEVEHARVLQRALGYADTLKTALNATAVPPLPTTAVALPSGGSVSLAGDLLAQQLHSVAQVVAASDRLGMRRQVFMVSVGGFDSHSAYWKTQPALMGRVALSVSWFLSALQSLGRLPQVTLFTASDFGRTLLSNGDGSDHGWGGHHVVAGGAVRGREIYGRMPESALGTADDLGSGRLLPSTAVSEMAATLGQWMGLSEPELQMVFPNLRHFSATARPRFLAT